MTPGPLGILRGENDGGKCPICCFPWCLESSDYLYMGCVCVLCISRGVFLLFCLLDFLRQGLYVAQADLGVSVFQPCLPHAEIIGVC